jgi:hypothetical protein
VSFEGGQVAATRQSAGDGFAVAGGTAVEFADSGRDGSARWPARRLGGSGDEHRDRDELACCGGAYEGVKDLVIAEH